MGSRLGTVLLTGIIAFAAAIAAADDPAPFPTLGKTWLEIGGVVYGAKPDERGPIGGGPGYGSIVTNGDYRVRTAFRG